MRWNESSNWVRSNELTHEPLITARQWDAVQAIFTSNKRRTGVRPTLEGRKYILMGLVRCGACGRRMEGNWNNGKAHYRCQVRRDDPVDRGLHPRTIYLKEATILPHVDSWVTELFDDDHLDHTAELLAAASEPDSDEIARRK